MKNDIVEHLFKAQIIDDEMREYIYAYFASQENA